jgi:peptide chain release factor 2
MTKDKSDKEEIRVKIDQLEKEMTSPIFWEDKDRAQGIIKEIADLKDKLAGENKYDKGDAVLSIVSGAGGDDAEDWARLLFEMYYKFIEKRGWQIRVLHEHKNEMNGIKNITIEVEGKGVYGVLKNESGVHRLVRKSPFSSKSLRHTSFALVEIVPKLISSGEVNLSEDDLRVELSRSGGAGGQNVNKRETAVRIVHLPTNIAVRAESERTQERNKQKAMELLRSKIYKLQQEQQREKKESMKVGGEVEWGHQIRSYVFHPYQMVKDHRTDFETSKVDDVLDGEIEGFIEAEKMI